MAKKGQNLVNAIDTVNGLPAIDFNSATRETQDAFIECQPSIPDPSGTAQYGANNEIKQYLDLQTISRASAFICSGSGNAYVLTTDTAVHLRQFTFIQKYSKIHFIASFTNTGACTVNVDFFGIKSIKLANGNDLIAGYITAGSRYTIYYNGTNWVLTNPTISNTYIKQQIILSNNITNPNTHIDFAAGNFAFSDFSNVANFSAITKRLDANFVAGNNQGGLDIGTKANSTRYYCYAIYNPTTLASDVIFSISAPNGGGSYTGSNMPSGYTKNRYIGALRTNASGNIVQGTWCADGTFIFKTGMALLSTTSSAGAVTPLTNVLPSVNCIAHCNLSLNTNGAGLSNFSLWGNLQTAPSNGTRANEVSTIATNNGFASNGNAFAYSNNGTLYCTNTIFAGGVSLIEVHLISYTDLQI